MGRYVKDLEEKGKDLPHDTIELQLGYLRSLEGICAERITDDVLLRPLLELRDKFIVDILLDINPRARAAALPMIEVDPEIHPRDGIVDISILEDDVRTLPAKLKCDFLEIRARGGLHDLSTDNGTTRKSDLVDIHMRG